MTEPRCPWCNTTGLKNVQAAAMGPALLVYCGQCGAIFGVAPRVRTAPPKPAIAAGVPAASVTEPGQVTVERGEAAAPPPVVVKSTHQPGLSPEQLAAMSPLFNRGGTLYRVVKADDKK